MVRGKNTELVANKTGWHLKDTVPFFNRKGNYHGM